MDLDELRTRVRSLTSILSTSVLSDDELDAFINEAHNLLCLAADWPFMVHTETVTFGTGDDGVVVPLPSGRTAQRVLDVYAYGASGDKPWQMFERAEPRIQEDSTGWPREFEWVAATDTLRVYPVPSKDFQVRVRLVLDPVRMVDDADEPLLPVAYRHGIAYMASALLLEREADTTGRVDAFQARAAGSVEEMRRLLLTTSRPSFIIGGRRSGRRSNRRQVW
jgi:hypothetical protein